MKKRILSLVMALVLAVGLLPVGAMAGEDDSIGTVTFSIETKTIDGNCLVEPMEEELYSGDTVYTILTRVAAEKNLTVAGADTGYVTQIGAFSASEYGDQSGWMVAVNNDHTSWPLPELKDGDSIRFCYTYLTYGYDIDLIDLVDELTEKVALAEDYNGENTEAVASAMAEASSKLIEIYSYESNQAYLNAVNIYGTGSETSEIEYLIRKLDTALNGGSYIPVTSAEITLANSNGTSATEFYAGQTYQAHIAFTPEAPTEQGSGWKLVTGMGVNAEIAADGTLTIQELTDDLYGIHMLTIQYWHPDADNGCYTKAITVKEPPQEEGPTDLERANTIMDNISASYVDNSSEWVVMDMAAYEKLMPDTASKTSAAAKQAYINAAIASVNGDNVDSNTYSKAILSLTAIGVDPAQLYPVNSNTPIDCTKQLKNLTIHDHYRAPWVLLANLQGSLNLENTQIDALISLLKANQMDSGMFGYEGDGQSYTDPDTTGTAIAALASLYNKNENAKEIIDKAISGLSITQNSTTGSFGNANSDAMVIIGLASVGIDPSSDPQFVKNGNSLLDGLLSFALADNSGFGFTDNTKSDELATEQGFRALIAAAQVMSTGEPYNIYDFSANSVTPARETSSSDESTTPPTGSNDRITVTVTIKADTGYWLRSKSVTVSEGSTVCDAFVTALDGTGITQVGAETGYIRSITKNGVTLAEFTQGPNSGWLYKVNGELPNVGVTTCTLNAGDSVVLYYTEDWTRDPSAGGNSGTVTPAPSTPASSLTPEVSANSKGDATVKVDANAVEDSLAQAEKENASALVIAPKVTGQADTVTTQLPLSAAETISQDSNLDLTVQTEDAAVTIPNEALGSIVTQSSGSQTIEVVVKTCDPNTLKDQAAGLDLENAAAVEVTIRSGGSPITTFGGQTLAIDLPVDKTVYTEGAQYKVLVLSADGTVETLTGQCIREQGRLVVRVFTPHLSTFLVTTQTVLPFTDVDGHWALDAIRFVYDQGLMTGTKETQFSPNKTLNRAMLATILYRMEGSPAVTGENPYTDVAAGTWYTDAVLWASEQGIVNGYGNGKFGPLNNITREQLAAMLLRYSDYKKYNTDARNDLASYADADDISAWALEALRWANAQGLVTGRTETTLVPQGATTRAETATILMRYLDTIAG